MTVRSPLVRLSTGKIAELPNGDSILGAPAGPSGSAATVAVGTTTTLAAGSSATVSNAGTSSAAVLDFGIPEGATGATGATGPAGPAGGMAQIAQVVAAASQSTITFSSIPGTYSALRLDFWGRDTSTTTTDTAARLKINGDGTAADYTSSQKLLGTGTSAIAGADAASASGVTALLSPGTSGNANALGFGSIEFPNYASTSFYKVFLSRTGTVHTGQDTGMYSGMWKSTAAITSLTLTAATTAFANGSVATLYGIP